jgi:aminomuconate-semialdehyde/2-hydroxymuconate-6-semialdehyde dehydrogenase
MERLSHLVNGKLSDFSAVRWLPVEDPATGAQVALLPEASLNLVDQAVQAAEAAFPAWSQRSPEQRAVVLRRLADLIDGHADTLARYESLDTGKPLHVARRVDIPRAAQNFRFFADAITQVASECHQTSSTVVNYTVRGPLGAVACISPWNLPLYLLTWKIAPALALGNCVVAKPSEITPLTATYFAKLCAQAGLPPGVLNVVHGPGDPVGAALCRHENIKAISFTGGTQTGAAVATAAASRFKKVSLELGGKNPALVFADCDLPQTVNQLVRASFANQGQICLCPSRLLVDQRIYAAFKEQFVAKVKELTVGDPNTPVDLGAVVSGTHQSRILEFIGQAKREGGAVLTGGGAIHPSGRCAEGYFVAPTVIEGLSHDASVNQTEIFGPVVTLTPFQDEVQAIRLANASQYGLAATVWTTHLARAHRVAQALETGIVWVNCWMLRDLRTPFGGMKASGVGREGGLEVLRFFTEPKNVCINFSDQG